MVPAATTTTGPTAPVAELLAAAGLLTQEQLAEGVRAATRTGSRPENIAIAAGWVRRTDVYRALAAAWDLLYLDDLATTEIDPSLLHGLDPGRLVEQGWFPVRRMGRERVLVATADPPTALRRAHIGGLLEADVVFAAVTGLDIDEAVVRAFGGPVPDQAATGLWRHDDDRSARTVLNRPQKITGGILLTLLAAGLAAQTRWTVVALSAAAGAVFAVSVLFTAVACLTGARTRETTDAPGGDPAPADADLPTYTVLVPVYREAAVVPGLLACLGALDYPAAKLQILLLVEEDDDETRAAAAASGPHPAITVVTVPSGPPRTRPKACNVGLYLAHGEHLVIYDAEDRPDPGQLRAAVAAFRYAPASLACIQARPVYPDAEHNGLTRMYALESWLWPGLAWAGLRRWRVPVPVGGPSSHFRTQALRVLGGWDPYDVNGGAGLGLRAAALRYTTGVVDSTTAGEANSAYGNLVRQRSRWIKGDLQTTLVHLRHPVRLVRSAGFRAASGLLILAGITPLSLLCVPWLYLLLVISLVLPPGVLARYYPGWVLGVSVGGLLLGNALMIYLSMAGAFARRRHALAGWALLHPVYSLLHSIAAYRAVWQLLTRPHYWEKTVHGLSTAGDGNPARAPRYTGHHRQRRYRRRSVAA